MEKIAELDGIPPTGMKFKYQDGPFEQEGILLRFEDGTVRAFKNECRHLPMPLDGRELGGLWDENGRYLVCNSHGARFQPTDGLCVSGPCKGSHLKEVPLTVVGNEVFVNSSATGSFFDV